MYTVTGLLLHFQVTLTNLSKINNFGRKNRHLLIIAFI